MVRLYHTGFLSTSISSIYRFMRSFQRFLPELSHRLLEQVIITAGYMCTWLGGLNGATYPRLCMYMYVCMYEYMFMHCYTVFVNKLFPRIFQSMRSFSAIFSRLQTNKNKSTYQFSVSFARAK